MEQIHVATSSRPYDVLVGAGLLDHLGELIRDVTREGRCCVVTETNVGPLYADRVEAALGAAGLDVAGRITFPVGEASKTLATLGLAAALYLRGIKVVQVPTSLLAMVDSSVGGKTAVDLTAGKNLVGAFWQPSLVVADVDALATVPPELFRDSCGEVVKHAVLADADLLDTLTAHPLTESRGAATLVDVVARNVRIKRDVVVADEREGGLRQTLNLGHTVGHAIESASDFSLGHGSCVAAGLCVMARGSAALGWCSAQTADRIERCVAAHGLPTSTELPTDLLMRYAAHDKKRHGAAVNVVVPREVARCEVRCVDLDDLRRLIDLGR